MDLANAHELNPFKGWYKTGDTLPTDGFDGAYLYFKDTSELTGQTTIYRWNGTTYADTGTVVDTSNVQTFETGQSVNGTGIKDLDGNNDPNAAGVLSAEAGKELADVTTEIVVSENILNPNSIILNRRIKQDGIEAGNNTTTANIVYGCTPYIELPDEGLTLNHGITTLGSSVYGVIIYNSDFVKIGKKSTNTNGNSLSVSPTKYTEEAAQGVEDLTPKYVRFNLYKPEIPYDGETDGYAVYNGTTLPQSFTPYFAPYRTMKKQVEGIEELVETVNEIEAKTKDIAYSEELIDYTSADGYVDGNTGVVEGSETVKVATVGVGSATKIKFLGYQLSAYDNVEGCCFVDGDDAVLLSLKYAVNLDTSTNGKAKVYSVAVPNGAVALKCSVRASDISNFYAKKVEGTTVSEAIAEAVNPVVSVVDKMEKVAETSLTYGTDTLEYGILLENNTVLPNNSVRYLDTSIAVRPGDVVQAYAYYLKNGDEVKYPSPDIQSVCCFKGGVNVRYGYRTITSQNASSSSRVEYYTVPEGVDAVKLSLASAAGYSMRKIIVWRGAVVPYAKVSNNDNYDQRLTVDAMEAGQEYGLPYCDVWSNRIIAFSAKVTRDAESGIGTLTIGNKTFGSAVGIFGSSATSIVVTDSEITIIGSVNGNETLTHGLTIENDIQFIAETDRSHTQLVKVVLRSNGVEYSVTNFSHKFGQVGGERFVSASVGGVFSSVSFCNTIKDLLAPVWVFGDSYLSNNGSSRWVHWAEENNVKNFMISSFAGAHSMDEIRSFRSLIAIHRPKVVCWFLGMNDPDSTGSTQSGTPDSSWLSCVREVIETCDNYGVVVVLATIPSVRESGATAIWSNKAKNAWVKASGRRYFDEEAAVGATEDGVWITGYKESDGVHPSTTGAKALFTRMLADVPEIMFKG